MTKFKVTHLTSVHPRYDTRIFVKMCCSLASLGYDVSLVVADEFDDETRDKVRITSVGQVTGRGIMSVLTRVWRVYREALAQKANIYQFHDPELMLVGILLRIHGKKVVYDVHEDLPRQILRKQWIPKVLRRMISVGARIFENLTGHIVNGVVTVTPRIAERFSYTDVVEVRNYASLAEFPLSTRAGNISEDKSLVSYVGGITASRGIIPMIMAASKIDGKLVIAGKFQEEGLREKSELLEGWNHVDFRGWLNRDEISQLLNSTLIGLVVLQPTGDYEDAFPVKLFEYMAAGAAVIVSDFPEWRKIVDKARCGRCVDPTNHNDIADAINSILNNKDQALKMGLNGRKAIEDEYNWESQVTKLEEFYRAL